MEQSVLERLLVEFNELNDKVSKCREFLLDESKSSEIDALNKDLLIAQLKVMESYLSILSIRIGLNAPKQDNNEEPESEQVND